MTQWEWYSQPNMLLLFVHCLLKANWDDKRWQGVVIKAGSFVTSYRTLAKETNLTVKQVRVAIKKLVETGELGTQSTNKYTVISIENYSTYQIRANKGQAKGQASGTVNTRGSKQVEGRQKGKQRATTNNIYISTDGIKKKALKEKQNIFTETEAIEKALKHGKDFISKNNLAFQGGKYSNYQQLFEDWVEYHVENKTKVKSYTRSLSTWIRNTKKYGDLVEIESKEQQAKKEGVTLL